MDLQGHAKALVRDSLAAKRSGDRARQLWCLEQACSIIPTAKCHEMKNEVRAAATEADLAALQKLSLSSSESEPTTADQAATEPGSSGVHLVGRQQEAYQAKQKARANAMAEAAAKLQLCTAPGLEALLAMEADLEDQLATQGFAVVDKAASMPWLQAVRAEILHLHELELLALSQNRLATSRSMSSGDLTGVVADKEGVFELDIVLQGQVVRPDALKHAPTLRHFSCGTDSGNAAVAGSSGSCRSSDLSSNSCNSNSDTDCQSQSIAQPAAPPSTPAKRAGAGVDILVNRINEHCRSLDIGLEGLDTLKVQYNTGENGCFPIHYDTLTGASERGLTAVIYLNSEWQQGDGGELRVFPFPFQPVNVEPRMGRMVLFSSTMLAHRTLPAFRPRFVLSLWFKSSKAQRLPLPQRMPAAGIETQSGARVNQEDQETLKALKFLWQPANRRVISKVIFADEWANSLTESFGKSEGVMRSVALHYREVEHVRKQLMRDLHYTRVHGMLPLRWEGQTQSC